MKLIRFFLLTLVVSFPTALHAGMLRVIAIEDAQTIVVQAATPTRVRLAGVAITDPVGARAFLEVALTSAWVTGEKRGDAYLVWRSPDAMFVNRELVSRGHARATSPDLAPQHHFTMTYFGQFTTGRPQTGAATVSVLPDSGSGIARRPPAKRSPQPRPPRKSRAARARPSAAPSSAP